MRSSNGVDGDDSRGLLTSMLQRIQTEMRDLGGIGMGVDSDDSTHDQTPASSGAGSASDAIAGRDIIAGIAS